jgi:hypothetical protein
MLQKTKEVIEDEGEFSKIYPTHNNVVTEFVGIAVAKKRVKKRGNSPHVIENTCRKNVNFSPFQDIYENKGLMHGFPRC